MKHLPFAVLALCALTVGCKPNSNEITGSTKTGSSLVVGIVFDKYGLGDRGLNDNADAGLIKAQKELHFTGRMVDCKSEFDYAPNLDAMASQGADIVIGVGKSMNEAVAAAAKKHPGTKFILVDGILNFPNVQCLTFRDEQSAYLAGYLAGLVTKSKQLGFVAAVDSPEVEKIQYSFQAGALTANPKVQLLKPKFTNDWTAIDRVRIASTEFYKAGADIVFHDAGRGGFGAFVAAAAANKFAIGNESDQDYVAPGRVLTSSVKHADTAVFDVLKDAADGKFVAGTRVFELKNGGVGLSEMRYTKKGLDPAVLKKMAEVTDKLKDGKIEIPVTEAAYNVMFHKK